MRIHKSTPTKMNECMKKKDKVPPYTRILTYKCRRNDGIFLNRHLASLIVITVSHKNQQ